MAVVPEERSLFNEQASANAASVLKNAWCTASSIAYGKAKSSTMYLRSFSFTNTAASLPSCPSKTWHQLEVDFLHVKTWMDACPCDLFYFVQRRYMDYIHILNDFKSTYDVIKIPQDSCDEISWLIYMINVEVSFNWHNLCKDEIYINMIRTKEIHMLHTRF